jgi:mono/diheme cytochrome c family protein
VKKHLLTVLSSALAISAFAVACGGDDDPVNTDSGTGGTTSSGGGGGSAGAPDGGAGGTTSSGGNGGTTSSGGNGGTTTGSGGSGGADAGAGGMGGEGGAPLDPEAARGKYLVHVVSGCIDCHTPRTATGAPDVDNLLAGVECLIDVDPTDDEVGCIHSRNLTDHETGLRNRSDEEIKDMFMRGVRPNGEALHPFMPYWSFGNMTEEDGDAIVAYLRTLRGVDHQVPANQPPFTPPAEPAPLVDLDQVPEPEQDDENYESAMRGRYLAAQAGPCLECHTPSTEEGTPEPRDLSMVFSGGEEFPRAALGLPDIFPEVIVTPNLTSDATGLEGWTAEDVYTVLKEGVNPDGKPICPPMPAGMAGYVNLTDEDAMDIANYIISLPPIVAEHPVCEITPP